MNYLLATCFFVCIALCSGDALEACNIFCPPGEGKMQCGFNEEQRRYKMFPSKCAMGAFSACYKSNYVATPLKFCINNQMYKTRRLYGESCPVFCPNHYRPVCGASKLRTYMYKAFNNGCYFDMLNCRGDDTSGYIEVPLSFCQKHLMKNIFKEQVVVSNFNDYRDYHEY